MAGNKKTENVRFFAIRRSHTEHREAVRKARVAASFTRDMPGSWGSEVNTHLVQLLVDNLWIERDLGGGWVAAYRIGAASGSPVVAEVRVFPNEPDRQPGEWSAEWHGVHAALPVGGLTGRVLKRVTLRTDLLLGKRAIKFVHVRLGGRPSRASRVTEVLREFGITKLRTPKPEPREGAARGGRPRKYDDRELAHIIALCEAEQEAKHRNYLVRVARRLGKEVSSANVRDIVNSAKKRDIAWGSGKRGQPGVGLTEYGRGLLSRKHTKRGDRA
jgi:hypothetical protein